MENKAYELLARLGYEWNGADWTKPVSEVAMGTCREELAALVAQGHTDTWIANKLGFSSHAVGAWRKKWGIPTTAQACEEHLRSDDPKLTKKQCMMKYHLSSPTVNRIANKVGYSFPRHVKVSLSTVQRIKSMAFRERRKQADIAEELQVKHRTVNDIITRRTRQNAYTEWCDLVIKAGGEPCKHKFDVGYSVQEMCQ